MNITNKQTGFTLIELVVTIAIAAILLGIAVPSFRTTITNNRITGISNALISSLVTARSEAIKRNANVRITAISSSDTSNEWGGGGWRIWVDDNGDGSFSSGSDTLIRQVAAVDSEFIVDAGVSNKTEIEFQASGLATASETFAIEPASSCPGTTLTTIRGRKVMLNATGRASSVNCSCDSSSPDPC